MVIDGPTALVNLGVLRRRHLGYVFQKANLVSFLNARENVEIVLRLNHAGRRAASRRAMELLEPAGHSRSSLALSAGPLLRPAAASGPSPAHWRTSPAWSWPTSRPRALDGPRGRQVVELFRDIVRQSQAAVIVVTHDHRVLDLFDRIYVMEDGPAPPRANVIDVRDAGRRPW